MTFSYRRDRIIWNAGSQPHRFDFSALKDSGFSLIDQFRGMLPYLTTEYGIPRAVRFEAAIILDSDVASYLQKYLDGNLAEPQRQSVEKFLHWFASCPNINIHPGYNLLERVAQSKNPDVAQTMSDRTIHAILSIECMDRPHYLATGEIRVGNEGSHYLASEFGTADLSKIARLQTKQIFDYKSDMVDAHYCFLLKVALIRAKHPGERDFIRNVEETVAFITVAFIEDEFKIASTIEMTAALLRYTRRGFSKFLGIERNTKFETAKGNVMHSAWDCVFTRVPQMFLSAATPERAVLGFLLTNDADSAKVASMQVFQRVIAGEGLPSQPYWDPDFEIVAEHLEPNPPPARSGARHGKCLRGASTRKEADASRHTGANRKARGRTA